MGTIADKYTFTIDFPNVGSREVFPNNGILSWQYKKEQDRRYFRKELLTRLIFQNDSKEGITDFDPWYQLEINKDRCSPVKLAITGECSTYNAKANVMDGDFDADVCRVDVKFEPDDPYACIMDNWEREENILRGAFIPPQTLQIYEGTIELSEFCVTELVGGQNDLSLFNTTELERFQGVEVTNCINQNEGWTLWRQDFFWNPSNNPNNPDEGIWTLQTQFVRERINTAVEPDSYGWIPVAAGGFARIVPTKMVYEEIRPGVVLRQYDLGLPGDVGIDNGRYLNDILLHFFDQYCGPQLVSNFFGINPDGTQPANDAYTEALDKMQEIMIFAKGDIIRHDADQNNTILNISLKRLLDHLQYMFNVEFRIRDNKIYLEHWSYFEKDRKLDLTQEQWSSYIKDTYKWTYAKEELPSKEVFLWEEPTTSEGRLNDFDGLPITYAESCRTGESDKTYAADKANTDIETLILDGDPDNWTITSESMVFVATQSNVVIRDLGKVTGEVKINAPLAWANLHESFHKHGRYLKFGYMNAKNTEFTSIQRLRKQTPIKIHMCCEDLENFDPERLIVQTQLGFGEIESAVYDEPSEILTLNLIFE